MRGCERPQRARDVLWSFTGAKVAPARFRQLRARELNENSRPMAASERRDVGVILVTFLFENFSPPYINSLMVGDMYERGGGSSTTAFFRLHYVKIPRRNPVLVGGTGCS